MWKGVGGWWLVWNQAQGLLESLSPPAEAGREMWAVSYPRMEDILRDKGILGFTPTLLWFPSVPNSILNEHGHQGQDVLRPLPQ
jgi:hypothetical protein